MRVVFLTHNYPRFAGDVAGAFLHPLALALCARGVDVRVIAPSDEGQGGSAVLDGIPVERVRYASPRRETLAYRGTMAAAIRSPAGLASLLRLRSALAAAARTALAGVPDGLVHAHWWIPGGLAAPPEARTVLTCHGTDVRLLDRTMAARWLARPVFARAAVVTTVSRMLAATIERRMGRSIGDAEIQPMPVVDVPRLPSTGGGGVIVIGRLTTQKRVHLALGAFALLRQRGIAKHLTIVGDGPARASLEAEASRLGVTADVRFAGEVEPRAVPEFLGTADCCLMPAFEEGLGLAAAEALMQGVPVVACDDGGGLLDVVPGSGGGRVVAANPEAIGNAAADIMRDGAARPAALVAGEQWHRRLMPSHVADRCMSWYARACHA
ncbi:MAG TPA: glycosyltransferase [Gemmatimonadales bacterium]|nr:glycosyltransferase [Gemmatimonadales bacterium]